jgi:hypothetical protein
VPTGMGMSLAAMGAASAGLLPVVWGAVLQEAIDVAVIRLTLHTAQEDESYLSLAQDDQYQERGCRVTSPVTRKLILLSEDSGQTVAARSRNDPGRPGRLPDSPAKAGVDARIHRPCGCDGCPNPHPIFRMNCRIHRPGTGPRRDGSPNPSHRIACRMR